MKLHEAIPPFSLIEDSIQGRRAETLVKTAYSCWLQFSPSLLLTIPTRTWAPSSFVVVSGPPLSPLVVIIGFGWYWLIIHLTRSPTFSTSRTQNQVFAHFLSLVHSIYTIAGLDNGDYSFLQLVCGSVLDSSVSPAWDGYRLSIKKRLLTIDEPFLANKARTVAWKTDRAED